MSIQIQLRRDLAANWTSANPILADGEAGYETDTGKIKLGDGVTAWTSLVYRFVGVSDHGALTGLGDDDHTQYHNDTRADTWLTGKSTTNLAEGTNLYFTESRVRSTPLTGLSVSGSTITATDTVLVAFGSLQNQINALLGGVSYQGVWNATTNSPTLTSSVGTKGHYYVVSVAGATNLDGITDWKLGDWVIFNGATWDKVDNTDAVISVNGATGAVTLTTSDISEGTNLYFTDERAQDALGTILTDSSSIDFTYDDGTPTISAVVLPAGVDHDALSNFVANEHVDHSAVSITAGNGLSGGGDLTATRTLDLDLNELTTVTAVSTDFVSIVDLSDSNNSKKALVSDIVAMGSGSYLKLDTSNGPLTGNLGITKSNPKLTLTDTATDSPTVYLEKLTSLDGSQLVSQNRLYTIGNGLNLFGGTNSSSLSYTSTGALSFSFWWKTTNAGDSYFIGKNTASSDFRWGSGVLSFGDEAAGLSRYWNAPSFNDGTWRHIALTISSDRATVLCYINGAAATQSQAGTVGGNFEINRIFATNGNTTGSFDDFIIYTKTLSAGEVLALYNAGAPSEITDMTDVYAYYKLNETSGTTASDASGNGRNLTLSGGSPTWSTGIVAPVSPAPSDVPVLKIVNNTTASSYGTLTLGYYSGSYGTANIYDGLSHAHRVLGTTRLQVTSAGITVTGAATVSSITASTLTISGALTMSGVINGCTQISVTNGFYSNAGLASSPSHSFSADSNSGMYSISGDTIGWACGGTQYMSLAAAALILQTHIRGNNGSTTFPTYAFANNTNTGMYRPASSMIGFVTVANERMRINDVGDIGVGTTTISARLHIISTTEQTRIGYDSSNYFSTTVSSAGAVTFDAVGASAGFTFSDSITLADAKDIIFNATTGTKIGGTGAKLALYGNTPIPQPSSAGESTGFTAGAGTAVDSLATFTGNVGSTAYTLNDLVKHLKNIGILAQ